MKRLFGLFLVLLAFGFVSCGLNDVERGKTNLEFSIPVADLFSLDDSAARAGDETEYEIPIYKIIVQLKGDKATEAQIQTINFGKLYTDEVVFSFEGVEPAEYEVMVDIFACNTYSYTYDDGTKETGKYWDWEFTGEQSVIALLGQDNLVEVELKEEENQNQPSYEVEFTYLDGTEQKTETAPLEDFISPENGIPAKYALDITDPDNFSILEYVQTVEEDTGRTIYVTKENPKVLKSIYLITPDFTHLSSDVFDSKLHFDLGFVNKSDETDKTSETVVCPKTEDGKYDVLPAYKKFSSKHVDYFVNWIQKLSFIPKEDDSLVYERSITSFYWEARLPSNDDNGNTGNTNTGDTGNTGDSGNTGNTEVFENEAHGSLLHQSIVEGNPVETNHTLNFNKRQNLTDKNRFIYAVDLEQILGNKTLNAGDTVVFVMKIPVTVGSETQTLDFTQFYYLLQKNDWEDIDNQYLFEGNECINCSNYPAKDGYYTFVMPFNFVKQPQDYKTVLFFFDDPRASATETQKIITVSSLDFHIFPASSHTFVFGLGQNWASNKEMYPYRYEFKLPVVDQNNRMLSLQEDDDVSVRLTGRFKYYGSSASVDLVLTSELYDGAYYTITSEYSDDNNNYYHPLSNTKGEAASLNHTTNSVYSGTISSDGYFTFHAIKKPCYDMEETDPPQQVVHDYLFQCYTPCTDDDPTTLLIIQNFKIESTNTAD